MKRILIHVFGNPNIVAPKTTVKLIENVKIKCDVDAKLYGLIPIKLLTNININNSIYKWEIYLSFFWINLIYYYTMYCSIYTFLTY